VKRDGPPSRLQRCSLRAEVWGFGCRLRARVWGSFGYRLRELKLLAQPL
jgi:hypothetical protein